MSDFWDWVLSLISGGSKTTTDIPEAPTVVQPIPEQVAQIQEQAIPGPDATVNTPGAVDAVVSMQQVHQIMPSCPGAKLTLYYPFLAAAMMEFSINTGLRGAAFLAQVAHESDSLLYFQEIASGAAYEGRADLGNTQPGDGRRYKGRGPIELTGRANYRICGTVLGLDLENNPERAADPDVGFRIAGWFWSTHGCNELADIGDDASFIAITRKINGGTNGLTSRQKYYATARQVLGV